MSEEENLPVIDINHTTVVIYKAKNGELKELRVVQPLNPDQRRMTFADLQMLAKQIAIVLKEDAL